MVERKWRGRWSNILLKAGSSLRSDQIAETLSSQGLETSKGGICKTFPGNLHLYVMVHIVKKNFSLYLVWISCFSWCLLSLIRPPGTSVMSLTSVFSLTQLLSDPHKAASSPGLTKPLSSVSLHAPHASVPSQLDGFLLRTNNTLKIFLKLRFLKRKSLQRTCL